jgi:hypothetical protein
MQTKGTIMKIKIPFSAAAVLTGSLLAAQAGPSDDVTAAAQKLGGESSYSWKTTTVVPADSQFKPGPSEGKTANSLTYVKLSFGGNTTEIYMQGTNAAVTNPDGGWQSLQDLANDDQGPGRFMVPMIRNYRLPAAQAADVVADCKDLEETNGAYASDLTDDGVNKLMRFGRRNANVTNPSGTAMFWVKDGELTKYEFHVKGTVSRNGNDVDVDRDTTVEISDVGSTKIDVPDDAKKLLP